MYNYCNDHTCGFFDVIINRACFCRYYSTSSTEKCCHFSTGIQGQINKDSSVLSSSIPHLIVTISLYAVEIVKLSLSFSFMSIILQIISNNSLFNWSIAHILATSLLPYSTECIYTIHLFDIELTYNHYLSCVLFSLTSCATLLYNERKRWCVASIHVL